MSQDDETPRQSRAGQFALGSLASIRSRMRTDLASQVHLFSDMRGALNWGVEAWLKWRGISESGYGWAHQEALFLRMAPADLQAEYLQTAGAIPRLAADLTAILGASDANYFAGNAPSLAPWRQRTIAWTDDAFRLVDRLLAADKAVTLAGGRRIARGRLQGDLSGLGPCVIVSQTDTQDGRWGEGDGRDGLFGFGEPTEGGTALAKHSGLILPIALCRDPPLASSLLTFARGALASPSASSSPLGTDLRSTLENGLRSEGLGLLHLVRWNIARTWLRFSLTREVFSDLLPRFDHVTAMADDKGQVSHILEHAPFTWTSQGSLLDWAMGTDDVCSLSPFKLYLVTDLRGLKPSFRSSRDDLCLFRPAVYWGGFVRPNEEVASASISVRFPQFGCGWIELVISFGDATARINLSNEFDPLPDLLNWLMAVRDGDLPIGVTIDDEGECARVIAHSFGEHRFLVAVMDEFSEKVRAAAVVDRDSFIAAFRSELTRFLSTEFAIEHWMGDGLGSEQYDTSYRDRLLAHPFLA